MNMTETNENSEEKQLEDYTFNKVKSELESWHNNENKDDIYVVSFLVNPDDDELPTLTIDYNTFKNWEEKKKEYSGSEMEVKWNYAFWLQDHNLILFDEDDKTGVKLRNDYLKFCYFRDNKNSKIKNSISFSELLKKRELKEWIEQEWDRFRDFFIDICINVSNRIHNEGIIFKIFGKELPIIINDLSDYESFLEWNKKANLNGEASELINTWSSW